MSLHADALRAVAAYQPDDEAGAGGRAGEPGEQAQLRMAYLQFLRAHPDGVLRSCVPAHVTASALVLDEAGERVLLTLHRKGGFWGQLGGHCEPDDATLAAAALREAREESGVDTLRLAHHLPVDLDRHALSAAFAPCGEHLDVRFAVVAPADARPVRSDESHDLAWFRVDDLPAGTVADLGGLVRRAHSALTGARTRG